MSARPVIELPEDSLVARPMRRDEIRHVRWAWWNLAALGHRLPPEHGVILIEGGKR